MSVCYRLIYTAQGVRLEWHACFYIWISDNKNCLFSGWNGGNTAGVGTKENIVQLKCMWMDN
jgi:hypothetical protein